MSDRAADQAVHQGRPSLPDRAPGRPGAAPTALAGRRRRLSMLTGRDKIVLAAMLGIPTVLHVSLVWLPTLASVVLSFTRWNGIGGLSTIKFIGLGNYHDIFTIYPPFRPALLHNVMWLVFFLAVATPMGMFLAVLLDRDIRGSRFYQSALFLPVMLSLVLVGFIWDLMYAPDQGLINSLLGRTQPNTLIDWLGNPSINIWAVLIAASWRHVGYIMILYLAGLKAVDPTFREAASIDGANA
ncbi:MAG: carbohydrate ABC transporter permease, partial [Chloroflexota bacterium]